MVNKTAKKNLLLYYLLVAFLEGIIALLVMVAIKSEVDHGLFLGLSKQRLYILFAFGLVVLLIGVLTAGLRFHESLNKRAFSLFQAFINKSGIFYAFLSLCLLAIIFILISLWTISISTNVVYLAYFERVEPIFWWSLVFFIETVLVLRIFRYGVKFPRIEARGFKSFLVFFFLCIILVSFVFITKIGLTPDKYQWRGPGTPILFWQVLVVIFLSFVVIKVGDFITRFTQSNRFKSITFSKMDWVTALFIWGLAFILWRAEPLNPNYFNPSLSPPNFEFYPYSDASGYDISAYKLLIGNGFEANVRRPLFSAFLAAGHWLLGNSYDSIVDWQLIFYSFFPVSLYLLGKTIHNRVSGLVIAGLGIWREITALELSGKIYVSNTKMIMSDFPTMLGVVIVTYIITKWLADNDNSDGRLFCAGCVIGLTMLIRLQAIVLLFVILAFIFIKHAFKAIPVFRSSIVFVIGIFIVVFPWLMRNFFVNGTFYFTDFSNPSQGGLVNQRYQGSLGDSSQTDKSTLDFILESPVDVVSFVAAHFFHNQINTLLALPSATPLAKNINRFLNTNNFWKNPQDKLVRIFSTTSYVHSLPYWEEWYCGFASQSYFPMGLNLLLIVFGITTAWRKHRLSGIFPLFVLFTYVLGISVFRISGWRFLMPVDWVGFYYFGIGVVQVITWMKAYFQNTKPVNRIDEVGGLSDQRNRYPRKFWLVLGFTFVFISTSIPLAELWIPQRYNQKSLQLLLDETNERLTATSDGFNLNDFLSQSNGAVYQGLALYPRFDLAGEGHTNSRWESHLPRDFSRLGFQLLTGNKRRIHIVLPVETIPDSFPNGSDVLVLGCQRDNYVLANYVMLKNKSGQAILHSSRPDWICP